MAFVKLDCGILDSTLWVDRLARELFITALLMADPIELKKPMTVLDGSSLLQDIYFKEIPPGWYGFVAAAGTGIIRRAGIEDKSAEQALLRLARPDYQSRSPAFSGRRMVRVDGGYVILNFDKYRSKDHTAAERSRRYRGRQASRVANVASRVTGRSVTQAEAEAEAEKKEHPLTPSRGKPTIKDVIDFFGFQQTAMEFWDYYESNGWRVGRNPMKDWRAAARRWKRNQISPSSKPQVREMSAFEIEKRIAACNDKINELWKKAGGRSTDEIEAVKKRKSELKAMLST